jgi:glycosyltransferase involved in cell wall biosynthesis
MGGNDQKSVYSNFNQTRNNLTNNPLVSICCLTYNHGLYIRHCINSLITQKTDFPFEIVVHDDASIDNTIEIIKEFEIKYPRIVRPIYQKINQRSLKTDRVIKLVFNSSKGKYIALCEGDDYWLDPFKLQKQVDYLERNKEFGLVHGNSCILNEKKKKLIIDFKKQEYYNNCSKKELFF